MRHAGGAKASDHDGMRGAEFAVRMWRREGLLIERMDEIHGIPIAAIEDEDESEDDLYRTFETIDINQFR